MFAAGPVATAVTLAVAEPVTLAITAIRSGAWTPAQLTDLALWLDADDASTITLNGTDVSQWDDKSSNGYNVSNANAATQPTYLATGFNGKPTLQVTGGDFLDRGTTALGRNVGGITCAIVGLHPTGSPFVSNANEVFISAAGNTGITRFATSPNATAGATADRYAIAGRRLDSDGFASVSSTTDSLANRGNPWIRVAQRAYSDGVANHWTDGTQDMTNATVGTQTAGNTSDTDSLRLSIFVGAGAMPNGTQLSEIVLTESTMTTEDRQKLEGYLAWKWGLTYALPANHPYRWDTSLFGGTDLSGFDADAKTYIASVETADAQELEIGVKTAINNFVLGCKADGIWTALKASAILAGARTLSGALQPLTGTAPTNFNFVSGDYDRKTGLKGNGSTKYLDSNRANDADPQDSNHNAVYVTALDTVTGRGSALMAGGFTETGSNNLGYSSTEPNSFFRNRSASSAGVAGGQNETGIFATNRSTSSTYQYRFGGVTGTITETSETPDSSDVLVFSRSDGFATDARLSFYSIGESLDLAALDTRVSALMTAIDGAIT
jgi:hypothetical protein